MFHFLHTYAGERPLWENYRMLIRGAAGAPGGAGGLTEWEGTEIVVRALAKAACTSAGAGLDATRSSCRAIASWLHRCCRDIPHRKLGRAWQDAWEAFLYA